MITVTTTYRTDASGRGKITAKANGKQLTTAYDPAKSSDRNHGEAAGNLLISGKFDGVLISLTQERLDGIVHMGFNDGTHKFNIPN